MTLGEVATLVVLLGVFVGIAVAVLVCAGPRPVRWCASCSRRIGGRHRPGGEAR
jgi:hypothetical protein